MDALAGVYGILQARYPLHAQGTKADGEFVTAKEYNPLRQKKEYIPDETNKGIIKFLYKYKDYFKINEDLHCGAMKFFRIYKENRLDFLKFINYQNQMEKEKGDLNTSSISISTEGDG